MYTNLAPMNLILEVPHATIIPGLTRIHLTARNLVCGGIDRIAALVPNLRAATHPLALLGCLSKPTLMQGVWAT